METELLLTCENISEEGICTIWDLIGTQRIIVEPSLEFTIALGFIVLFVSFWVTIYYFKTKA